VFTREDIETLAEEVFQKANEAFLDPLLTAQDGIKAKLLEFFNENGLMGEGEE
jgi:hypothetical protein